MGFMKITMVHGQNHKGSTYHIGKMLADKLGGEVTEFFLPKDFGHFCIGCNQCIVKDEKLCPYYKELGHGKYIQVRYFRSCHKL